MHGYIVSCEYILMQACEYRLWYANIYCDVVIYIVMHTCIVLCKYIFMHRCIVLYEYVMMQAGIVICEYRLLYVNIYCDVEIYIDD